MTRDQGYEYEVTVTFKVKAGDETEAVGFVYHELNAISQSVETVLSDYQLREVA